MVGNVTVDAPAAFGASVSVEVERKPWQMPKPTLGTVMWSNSDRSGGECYGVVTAVYDAMIDLMIYPSNSHHPQPRTGVKHVGDPSLKTMRAPNPGGVWDFCPGERHLREALADAGRIIAKQTEVINDLLAERYSPGGEEDDE